MSGQGFQATISTKLPPNEAFSRICRVSEWWTTSFTGASRKTGDTFNVRFGDTFVDFKVVEASPPSKLVWWVTVSNIHWVKNKKEWNDSTIEWDISSDNNTTNIIMTHRGLTRTHECFADCKRGWEFYFGESLRKLLVENKGLPDGEGEQVETDGWHERLRLRAREAVGG
jgi:hypothetical protein